MAAKSVSVFISIIENSLISFLAHYNVEAKAFKDRVGIWVTKSNNITFDKEKKIINIIENKFSVEKELLLALMGIETNYGKYLGKMDIISSLSNRTRILWKIEIPFQKN